MFSSVHLHGGCSYLRINDTTTIKAEILLYLRFYCYLYGKFTIIAIMKIVRNNIIPIKGYAAMNLFGVLFVRKNVRITEKLINHESIHTAQMKEMLYVPFYIWYVLEWLVRLFMKGNAYRNISFEREAYSNENDLEYLKDRKHYSWVKYLKG